MLPRYFASATAAVALASALAACSAHSSERALDDDPIAAAPAAEESISLLPGPEFLAAYAKTEDAYLIDCRTPREQAGGMLPGATAMDFNSPDFPERAAALDKERPVFVYCARGGRSAQAAAEFEALGFGRVVDLEGGYLGLER